MNSDKTKAFLIADAYERQREEYAQRELPTPVKMKPMDVVPEGFYTAINNKPNRVYHNKGWPGFYDKETWIDQPLWIRVCQIVFFIVMIVLPFIK